jgi:hypothetical protein
MTKSFLCITSVRVQCWIWKVDAISVIRNGVHICSILVEWVVFLYFRGELWYPTEMRAEHRSTPAHLSETVSYRLCDFCPSLVAHVTAFIV